MSPRLRSAVLAGHAATAFLCFPHPLGDRVLDLGAGLAWVSPALLVLGLRGLAPRRAAATAFAAGLVAHAAILHWIYVVTVVYGHAPVWAGVLAPLALAAYIAAFTAAFGAGFAWLSGRGLATPLAAALLWTCLDHLRSVALSGFPWATLGYAQHRNPALLGWVAFTGVYGLSFASVLGSTALLEAADALRAGRRPARGSLAIAAGLLLATGLGLGLASRDAAPGARSLRVAVLQGNVPQGRKWSPAWVDHTLAGYEELTRRAVDRGAALVVWPESAVPGPAEPGGAVGRRLAALARETGAALVVGAVGLERDARGRPVAFYDSAQVIGPDGRFGARYDKSHLVPFGEYVPLRSLLGGTLGAVASGIAPGDVSAGRGPRALELPAPGAAQPVLGAVPICYELIFPDLVRRFARDGAQLLLGITNDAWYGRTGAPYQFLAMTALRAAENRIWTARAANTGVSAIIDARGRVVARTRIFERDLLVADVPLRGAPGGGSFYARHGDVFAAGCWVGLLALGVLARRGPLGVAT